MNRLRTFLHIAPSAGAAHATQARIPKAPGRSCLEGTREVFNLQQGRRVSKHWMASVTGLSLEYKGNYAITPKTALLCQKQQGMHSKSPLPVDSEPEKHVTVCDNSAVEFQGAFDAAHEGGDGDSVIARKRRERKDSVTEAIFTGKNPFGMGAAAPRIGINLAKGVLFILNYVCRHETSWIAENSLI